MNIIHLLNPTEEIDNLNVISKEAEEVENLDLSYVFNRSQEDNNTIAKEPQQNAKKRRKIGEKGKLSTSAAAKRWGYDIITFKAFLKKNNIEPYKPYENVSNYFLSAEDLKKIESLIGAPNGVEKSASEEERVIAEIKKECAVIEEPKYSIPLKKAARALKIKKLVLKSLVRDRLITMDKRDKEWFFNEKELKNFAKSYLHMDLSF